MYLAGDFNTEELENDFFYSSDDLEDSFDDTSSEPDDSSEEVYGSLPPEPRFGNVEYKLQLVAPCERRFQHLVTQLKWRLRSGGGSAVYVLGVRDCGALRGLRARALRASLHSLRKMAATLDATLTHVTARRVAPHRAVAEVYVRKLADTQQSVELRVAVMGANEAGKSTLVGVLTQGELDNGRGSARLNMFRHLHEVKSGRTSSLSHEILGFDAQGNVVNYGCSELMTAERIGERSAKLVSFLDLAGHSKYQRTTLHGLSGYCPHWAMLLISATAGITRITEEHLGLLLALDLPFFAVVSKCDIAAAGVQPALRRLAELLRPHGKEHLGLLLALDLPFFAVVSKCDIAAAGVQPALRRLAELLRPHGKEHLGLLLALDLPFFAVVSKCDIAAAGVQPALRRLAELLRPHGKEHLGLLLALDLPFFAVVSKCDIAAAGVQPALRRLAELLRPHGKAVTFVTEEHLGLLLALDLPFFAVVSKCDIAAAGVQPALRRLAELLRPHGKKPFLITDENLARNCVAPQNLILDTIDNGDDGTPVQKEEESPLERVCVFPVSCVRGSGLNALHAYLLALQPTNARHTALHESCEFQIDEIFHVGDTAGPVVGGLMTRGQLYEGDRLIIGPFETGEFRQISVRTIYRNRARCGGVRAGHCASLGLALPPGQGAVRLRAGMVLLGAPEGDAKPVKFGACIGACKSNDQVSTFRSIPAGFHCASLGLALPPGQGAVRLRAGMVLLGAPEGDAKPVKFGACVGACKSNDQRFGVSGFHCASLGLALPPGQGAVRLRAGMVLLGAPEGDAKPVKFGACDGACKSNDQRFGVALLVPTAPASGSRSRRDKGLSGSEREWCCWELPRETPSRSSLALAWALARAMISPAGSHCASLGLALPPGQGSVRLRAGMVLLGAPEGDAKPVKFGACVGACKSNDQRIGVALLVPTAPASGSRSRRDKGLSGSEREWCCWELPRETPSRSSLALVLALARAMTSPAGSHCASLGLALPPGQGAVRLRAGMVLLGAPEGDAKPVKFGACVGACKSNDQAKEIVLNHQQNAKDKKNRKNVRRKNKNLLQDLANVENCLTKAIDNDQNIYKSDSESVDKIEDVYRSDSEGEKDKSDGECTCRDAVLLEDPNNPRGCIFFQASVHVLRHSTAIYPGFQCTVHVGNVRQTAIIEGILSRNNEVRAGSGASLVFRFTRNPEYLVTGRRLLLTAGQGTRGIGRVTQVFPYVP
ncbi:uncharacterized protein LOC135085167 [Ostrinia nubilalis]|uniref:uncharacterized protein LOC135085167 n=1 Tax=Ostrinia nubilalis TaxID=29057 RepID=UPI0030822E8B